MGKFFLGDIEINCIDQFDLLFDSNLKLVTTLNAELILKAEKDDYLRKIINSGIVTIDGFWTKYAFERKYKKVGHVNKMSGSSLIYSVVENAVKNNKKVLLLGAEEKENKKAVKNLSHMFNSQNIYGFSPDFSNYPFDDKFLSSIEEACKSTHPDIIITAFGVPKQEYWAFENQDFLKSLGVNYVMFFGGAIDIVSGKYKRAPKILQNLGLESLYRLIQDPKRLNREIDKLKIFNRIIMKKF